MGKDLAVPVSDARMSGVEIIFIRRADAQLVHITLGKRPRITINRAYGLTMKQIAALIESELINLDHAQTFYLDQQQQLIPQYPRYAFSR